MKIPVNKVLIRKSSINGGFATAIVSTLAHRSACCGSQLSPRVDEAYAHRPRPRAAGLGKVVPHS